MRSSRLAPVCFLLAAFSVFGQLLGDVDPDWKEIEVPPPPSFKTEGSIPIEMPRHISIKLSLDPDTLRITADGIVRYVMLATSPSGIVNASYEGIRCLTGQVKVYARFDSSGKWNPIADPQWRALNGNQASMHALALARQGACDGRAATAQSPATIIRKLKTVPLDATRR